MKVLMTLALVVFFRFGSAHGKEKSCEEWVSEVTPQLKKDGALKVYKKLEDKTRMLRDTVMDYSKDLSTYYNNVSILKSAIVLRRRGIIGKGEYDERELRVFIEIAKLAAKDVKDTSSEAVRLCFGRVRLEDGTRNLMFYVTKDEEGDRRWEARTW